MVNKCLYIYMKLSGGNIKKYDDEFESGTYNGELNLDDNREGYGKMVYDKNSSNPHYLDFHVYKGAWIDDQKSGIGKMTYYNGDVYEGLWENDSNIDGKLIYENGDRYEGIFSYYNEVPPGKYFLVNGDIFDTKVFTMKYKNGEIYKGDWSRKNGRENEGTMNYNDGSIYKGQWFEDKKNGKGIMKYANGDIYDGFWLEDKKDEKGKMTYANGRVENGEWKNDILFKHIKNRLKKDCKAGKERNSVGRCITVKNKKDCKTGKERNSVGRCVTVKNKKDCKTGKERNSVGRCVTVKNKKDCKTGKERNSVGRCVTVKK